MNTQATLTTAATARLTLDGKDYDLPVIVGTEGEKAIDIRKLRDASGRDHARPRLRQHRLVQQRDHLHRRRQGHPALPRLPDRGARRAARLPRGRLPADLRRAARTSRSGPTSPAQITRHTLIHEDMKKFFEGFPPHAHPMAILVGDGGVAVDLLPRRRAGGTVDLNIVAPAREGADDRGVLATRRASASRSSTRATTSRYGANFLHMMFAVPTEAYEVPPVVEQALNLLLILHADHEQNCSTSTVRMVGSSQANLFASISAGICALWGPLHGGANQEVIEMLEKIRADGGDYKKFVDDGEGQELELPPDGLRPPRLQELRPAREDPQEGRRRRARARSASTTRCSTSRRASRRSRSRTTTSSSASSTRTSTSTAASSTARWASRRTCSR